jgi:multisubunit Na+/H+ antiporter MnhG subunit
MSYGHTKFGRGSTPGTASDTAINGAEGNDSAQHGEDWQDELLPKLTIKSLFRGWEGTLVMGFGVLIPSLLIAIIQLTCLERFTLVFFDHPLETFAELLLVANIPVAIFMTWWNLIKANNAYSLMRGISLGASIGTSFIVFGVAIAAAFATSSGDQSLTYFFGWIAVPSFLAAIAGAFVVEKVRRTRDFASSRTRVLGFTGAGVVLATLTLLAAEAKPWSIRIAEHMAVSASPDDQREGLKRLQSYYPEREMLIECSDARAAGLCGLFLPLSLNSQRELYFAMTGEPFSFRDINNKDLASVSDESLARQVVGERISGLSLLRSSMTGVVHPETLSSTIDWTFVFKNEGVNPSEARGEIAIPHGAVVTGLTVWSKGEPHDASFSDPSHLTYRYGWPVSGVTSMVTDLGRGRMLVSCSGVPAQDELKLRLTTVVPLKPDAVSATLVLPKFVASNFDLSGEHSLRLRSSLALTSPLKKMKLGTTGTGEHLITVDLAADDLTSSNLMLTAERPKSIDPIATSDGSFFHILQSVARVPAHIPTQLVVVLDGSVKMEKYRSELAESLRKLPTNIPTSVILISNENGTKYEPITVKQAIADLQKNKFVRGQDNLKAMIAAAEVAGESKGGAVLWIHGPQPASNRENYIMGQYDARPTFYDLPLESGDTDTNEFFRNYSEIGPFEQLPRNGALADDLEHFFGNWKPGSSDYVITRSKVSRYSNVTRLASQQSTRELRALWASQEASKLLERGQMKAAMQMGRAQHFVNRACSAVLVPFPTDVAITPTPDATVLVETPVDAPATSQETQTTIYGLNSGGTVRVNNLANLEACLNIFANLVEILGLIAAAVLFVQAVALGDVSNQATEDGKPAKKRMGRVQRLSLAAACAAVGLFTPGTINWLVASARDANLFS